MIEFLTAKRFQLSYHHSNITQNLASSSINLPFIALFEYQMWVGVWGVGLISYFYNALRNGKFWNTQKTAKKGRTVGNRIIDALQLTALVSGPEPARGSRCGPSWRWRWSSRSGRRAAASSTPRCSCSSPPPWRSSSASTGCQGTRRLCPGRLGEVPGKNTSSNFVLLIFSHSQPP